jgi:DnaJ-class molecular chaperone
MTDPYAVLGVSRQASEAEIRSAYRRLVQLHHPDHNGGSEESERRFEEVQEAYAAIRRGQAGAPGAASGEAAGAANAGAAADPDLEARLADIEGQVREAHQARERARRAAAEAAAQTEQERPSDEELGYIRTDDTFFGVLADARSELAAKLSEGSGQSGARQKAADLLDEVSSMLRGEGRPKT